MSWNLVYYAKTFSGWWTSAVDDLEKSLNLIRKRVINSIHDKVSPLPCPELLRISLTKIIPFFLFKHQKYFYTYETKDLNRWKDVLNRLQQDFLKVALSCSKTICRYKSEVEEKCASRTLLIVSVFINNIEFIGLFYFKFI